MKIYILILLLLFAPASVLAQERSVTLRLYPDNPTETDGFGEEKWKRDFTQLKCVNDPTLTVCFPEKTHANGQLVILCPGGGYSALAIYHEGFMVAGWLNSLGITAAVLKYRMPAGDHDIPLKDALAGIELVRENAEKWGIDPKQIGIMGFSAGGHLALTVATHFTSAGNRPDFVALIYPVVTMGEYTHEGSRKELLGLDPSAELVELYSNEKHLSGSTPPLFIAFSEDDIAVDPYNGTLLYDAAVAHDIPVEMHLYPSGGHGWSFRDRFIHRDEFRASLSHWLTQQELK